MNRGFQCLSCGGSIRRGAIGQEEIMVVQIAVHMSGNLGGFGTESGPATLEENDNHNATAAGVRVGGKPAKARASVGAGSGFAQNFFFVEVEPEPACRTVLHRSRHAD